MINATIKRGSTLQYDATATESGVPVNLTGWTINSQVRTRSGELVGQVTATVLDQATSPGQYRLRADTTSWQLGLQLWDIAYSYSDGAGGSIITHTETVRLLVEPAATEVSA